MATRLVIAAIVAVPLSRFLLRAGIRQPRVRVLVAAVPAVVLTSVLLLSWANPKLPNVARAFDGTGMAVPVGNTYGNFAPMAISILLALWAVVASARVWMRLVRRRRAQQLVQQSVQQAPPVPAEVSAVIARVADRLAIAMPPVAILDDCPGGASIHGIRRPTLLLDARLVRRLDGEELEAVAAHELAHVKRRDNLTSFALGVVRDLFFFVPGTAWANRQLHAERELAADQLACTTTGRPGALASGLLKVLDLQGSAVASPAAALLPEMPESTLVGRVKLLVNPQQLSPARRRGEVVAIGTVVVLAAGIGLGAPAMVHGEGVRDLVLRYTPDGAQALAAATPSLSGQATAFEVYRSAPMGASRPEVAFAQGLDDDPGQFRPSVLAACRAGDTATCSADRPSPSLGLRPRTTVRLSEDVMADWHATPVITTDVFGVYLNRSK